MYVLTYSLMRLMAQFLNAHDDLVPVRTGPTAQAQYKVEPK